MNNVAIIILHFGDIKDTLECIESIERIPNPKTFKVFVVDNGTNRINAKNLTRFKFRTETIHNFKNLGYGEGMNAGIRKAMSEKFKYYLLLNNDVIVKQDIIDKLLAGFKNKDVGLMGPIVAYYDKPNKIWFGGGNLNSYFCFTTHTNMNKKVIKQNNSYTDFITGAAVMVKREVFEKAGFFDKDYFLYWEDVDYCQKAKKKGFKSYLIGESLVLHKVSSATGKKGSNKLSKIRAYYYARNPFIFMAKQKYKGINFYPALFGQFFIRLPRYMFDLEDFDALKEYLRGIKDGLGYYYNSMS